MNAIIFALISYLGWGIGDIFGTIVTRKIGSYSTTFWHNFFIIIIFSFYIPFVFTDLLRMTPSIALLNIVLAILGVVALIAFYEGLKVGNASIVGTIGASFSALVVLFSIIFLGEKISFNQSLAIIIIFIGLVMTTLDREILRSGRLKLDKGILFALIAMLGWGIYFTFIKIPVKQVGWFWPFYITSLTFPITFLFIKIKRIPLNNTFRYPKILLAQIASVLLLSKAVLAFNSAISSGSSSIVAPIAGSYPTLFVLLAFFIFRDKLNRQQIIGIITALIGIVFLSIVSS